MGIGFNLTGTCTEEDAGQAPEDWLEQVAAWLEGHEEEPLMLCRLAQTEKEQPALFVHVHPGAEEVEFCLPEPRRLIVSAKTSTLGPGYHLFLCDLLHSFGKQFGVHWHTPDEDDESGDETGYFFKGDADAVRHEMLRWLGALAHVVTDEKFAEESQVRMVAMPLGYAYPDVTGIVSPLGPRSQDWFESVLADPAKGAEFFPWWQEGVGAGFFLGRALCRMWQDVRWRLPVTDDEAELLMDVHLDLERACRLDDTLPIPWREWAELLDSMNDYFGYVEFQQGEDLEALVRTKARAAHGGPRIGYRRGPVQVSLTGGWSLVIPGDLAEEWETNGQTWSAWLGGRTIWFSSWTIRDGDDVRTARDILPDLDLPDGETYEHRAGLVLGRAVFVPHDEEGQTLWNLKAYSAVDGGFALCNVFVRDREDLAWALEVWKSLKV